MTYCFGCMAQLEDGQESGRCPHCGYIAGTRAESSLHMQPGTVLTGRYLIGRVIGYGGFGVTYIGWDNVLQQRVAIKEYLPSEFATRAVGQSHITIFGGNKAEQFADGMTKFIDEAKRLVRFQSEPGIVRVYDSFEANNTAYIIMEYLDGETLTALLEREKRLPVDRAVGMLTPVIQSLQTVHQEGIIHRDIAPDNIMITRDGQVKLIDFGAARYATTSHSRSLTVIIKPGYSPEEQYRSRGDQGPHTDVYALSAVLYRMVTGVTPPDALERRALLETGKKDTLTPPSKHCKLSKNLENAILNGMNVRIEDRTPTAEAFLAQLTSKTQVQRVMGKIKAIDLVKWPLWAKIVLPVSGAAAAVLLALLLTGRIGFDNNLITALTLGENMARVPSVVNCSVETAQSRLEERELTAMIGGRETSDTIPANMVLRQSVGAGEIVEKATSVELYISAATDPVVEDGTMPDVAYYTESQAISILSRLGAVVAVEREYHDGVAEGIVIRSSLSEGASLAEGDAVTLYVSMGPDPAALPSGQPDASGAPGPSAPSGEQSAAPSMPTTKPAPSTWPEPTARPNAPVTLDRGSLSLYVGDSANLYVSGGNGSYSWSSSSPGVATVYDGRVSAVGSGNATITVSSEGRTASCTVNVQDYSISISESYISLCAGESRTLSIYGAPSGASVSWESSNSGVATVSGGRVSAVSSGSTTITARVNLSNGRSYSASSQVTVTAPSIQVSRSSLSLTVGGTASLSASTTPSGQTVSWRSSNTSVATVNGSGVVTAVGAGTATITAEITASGRSYSSTCSVSVVSTDWSTTKLPEKSGFTVETKTQYRSSTKQTTTSTQSELAGWTRYDYSRSYGEWGPWSEWKNMVSYNPEDQVESRVIVVEETDEYVKTQTQYRVRKREEITTYYFYKWGDWSAWQDTPIQSSDTVKVETQTLYRYR